MKQNNKEIEKEADAYIENLYQAYGSETGVLFGIPSDLKASIKAIVKLTIQSKEKEMLDAFIQNINKRIMEIERLSYNDFVGKDSVLYELKDLKKTYEERLQKLKGGKE